MVGVSKRRQDQHPSNWLTGCKRFANVGVKIRIFRFTFGKSWGWTDRVLAAEAPPTWEDVQERGNWRLRPESNRRTRICNPLRHHSATEPLQKARH